MILPQVLPLVLLVFRAANREEFAVSSTELVYQGILRLSSSALKVRSRLNSNGLLHLIKDAVRKVKPPPSANYANNVLGDLDSCAQDMNRAGDSTF